MITKLLEKEGHFIGSVMCDDWEELVDIIAAPLVLEGAVELQFAEAAKEAAKKFGGYVVLTDDIAFFHARPEAGVHEFALTLALLKNPVYLFEKRIKVAFMLAAVDNAGHLGLLKELSEFMNDDECLEILRKGEDMDAIINKFKEVEEKHEVS